MLNMYYMKVYGSSQELIKLDVTNAVGSIIIISPGDFREYLAGGVVLLTHVIDDMVIGLRMDYVIDGVNLSSIMRGLGFTGVSDSVYLGGVYGSNRLHIIHSLDWSSSSTVKVCDGVGVTSDITILRAMSENVGPSRVKACAGHLKWELEYINDHLDGCTVIENGVEGFSRWGCIGGDSGLIFNYSGRSQFRNAANRLISAHVDRIFNR
jgi:putative AlgH/UPF0301 family transcriptional regulator